MISFIHDKLKYLLIAILILLIAAFMTWDYNNSSQGGGQPTHVGEISHKRINRAQFSSAILATQILYNISPDSYSTLLQSMMRSSLRNREQIMERLTWDRILIVDAAERAGIVVTSQEAMDFIQKASFFQENGKFSRTLFKRFDENFLKPQGITDGRFEEIIREQIMFDEMTKMVSNMAIAPNQDVNDLLSKRYSPTTVSVIRFDRESVLKTLKPTKEDLEKHYNDNIKKYSTPEQRVVEYVEFSIPGPLSLDDMPEKEKKSEFNKLGKQAYDFAEQFRQTDDNPTPSTSFTEAAQNESLTIKKSRELKQNDPFYESSQDTAVTRAIFQLNDSKPISSQIKTESGYLVAKLIEVKSPEPIPYKKVAKQVEDDYLAITARNETSIQGGETRKAIQEQLDAGKTWEEATKSLKAKKAETLEPFIPAEANDLKVADANIIRSQTPELRTGELSSFIPTASGGILLYVSKRDVPSADKVAALKPVFTQQLTTQERAYIIQHWIQGLYKTPGHNLPELVTQPGV